METEFGQFSDGQLLAAMNACLDALSDDRLRLPSDAEQLVLLQDAIRVGSRVQTLVGRLAARVEQSEAAWSERKTSTRTWLAEGMNLTGREAGRLIKAGQRLARFPMVAEAAAGGAVLATQAEAIAGVLDQLPPEFDEHTIREAQQLMVGFAHSHNSGELCRLTAHLVEVLSPETADELEMKRLERRDGRARTRRFLEFREDGDGSVLIRGSLPVLDAEPLIRIVEAYAAAEKRGLERLDPSAEQVTAGMRRVDGLLALVAVHERQATAPVHGGDRPRIVVTLSYDKLAKHCADAGLDARLVRDGQPVPAGAVRRLLCDVDVLPVVLGGASEPLDVGRSQRLVTPPIRAALELRDGGCVFPGCDKPPEQCEAHHLTPWYRGGPTSLSNLVLLCRHHHGICEPSRNPADDDRWQVALPSDQLPVVIPPRRVDPTRRPRRHARFTTRTQAHPRVPRYAPAPALPG